MPDFVEYNNIKFYFERRRRKKEMLSCLGLYIEPNIIKYAKVSKEKDTLKVESFGDRKSVV